MVLWWLSCEPVWSLFKRWGSRGRWFDSSHSDHTVQIRTSSWLAKGSDLSFYSTILISTLKSINRSYSSQHQLRQGVCLLPALFLWPILIFLSFIAGSHFAYVLSCCLLCSCSCFHSWNSFRPSSLWKKAIISGRKVLTIASSSCFGTPLFVSDEGGTSSIWISFLSVWIVAIRQRFYLCRSFLLLDSDRLCPLGDRFHKNRISQVFFICIR